MSKWAAAQLAEAAWWGTDPCAKWASEIEKQQTYAALMGMPDDMAFGDKRILDVGCGPVSMLLRSTHGPSVALDPMPLVRLREEVFRRHGVEVVQDRAEEMNLTGFDEVWCYNVLQHVENPREVLRRIALAAPVVRLFEWVGAEVDGVHLHVVTAEMIAEAFHGWSFRIWNAGNTLDDGRLHGDYVAMVAERWQT